MTEIGRVITAMVTPFTPDDRVDYATAQALALALLDSGSDGLVLCGSTGEGVTLTREEKLTLVQEVRAAVGDRAPLIVNSGNYATAASIELTEDVAKAGADVALWTVPYYNKPPQAGLRAHFDALATHSPIPGIIYNVPSRTVTDIAAETVIALSQQHASIIGIKDAAGNFDKATRIIAESRAGFRYWSGDDNITLPLLSLGAWGVVSIVSHLVGHQVQRMIAASLSGDAGTAMALHRRLLPLINGLFVVSNPIPMKYALSAAGFPVGPPRLPLVPADTATREVVDALLASVRLDLAPRTRG